MEFIKLIKKGREHYSAYNSFKVIALSSFSYQFLKALNSCKFNVAVLYMNDHSHDAGSVSLA